jgi:hypothetical protein
VHYLIYHAYIRFQILVHKEEYKKKKAEEEKTKAANGNEGREKFANMLNINDAAEANRGRQRTATMESIQAQAHAQAQAQAQQNQAHQAQAQLQGHARLPQGPNVLTPGSNPGQLAQLAAAHQAAQAQQNQSQPQIQSHPAPQAAPRRAPLPRVASQDQIQQQGQRAPPQVSNMPRQLQPTGPASNAPTPASSSPQVPIPRLPATPRNVPGTPRPPGTPQPQPAKHTPQPNGQAMTPASTQPSPMLKSASQSDESQLQQMNGARQFARAPGQMMNGIPQPRPPGQQQPQFAIPQFLEVAKIIGHQITYEQYLSLSPENQALLTARVQEHVQRTLAAQKNGAANQQTVQGAYQQAQIFLQQAQRNVMPLQPGQGMTSEHQRILAQTKQQFLGGADPELIRQQLAQQGRQANEVQAMLQQQLSARRQQQNAAQQAQQRQQVQPPPPQNLAQQRQMGLQQAAAAQGLKLANGQQMTPEQVQIYRARQLQLQAVRAAQQQNVNNMGGIGLPMQQFLNSLSQEHKAQFQSMDGQSQATVFTNWMATRQAAHQQQQQQQQQQQTVQQQGVPQLQYNPMAAQNMAGAGRMPVPMVGMAQGQGTPNGVGGPAMMRQSTSGGGA